VLGGYEIASLDTADVRKFARDLRASYQCQGGIKEMKERWPKVMAKNAIKPMPKPVGLRTLLPNTAKCMAYFQSQARGGEEVKLYSQRGTDAFATYAHNLL